MSRPSLMRPLELVPDELDWTGHWLGEAVWQALNAARDGDTTRLRVMLEDDPTLVNAEFWHTPPLHFAVREGHLDATRMLLEAGADIFHRSLYAQETLLQTALDRGHDEVADLLRDELRRRAASGSRHAIHLAVSAGDTDTVEQLLAKEPGLVNHGDHLGRRPLHCAVEAGHSAGRHDADKPSSSASRWRTASILRCRRSQRGPSRWRGLDTAHMTKSPGSCKAMTRLEPLRPAKWSSVGLAVALCLLFLGPGTPAEPNQAISGSPLESTALKPREVLGNLECTMMAGRGAATGSAVVVVGSASGARFSVVDSGGSLVADTLPFRPHHFRLGRQKDGTPVVGLGDLRPQLETVPSGGLPGTGAGVRG